MDPIKVAVVRAVSLTVRDSFQLKWKLMGCFFGAALSFWGGHMKQNPQDSRRQRKADTHRMALYAILAKDKNAILPKMNGSIGNIYQAFAGQEIYPSVEE